MRMERVMNFKEEQKEKVEKIEAILREYLPEAKRISECDHGSNGIQSDGRRQAPSPNADDGNIPSVWWRDRSDLSVYGSDGDDPYLFTGS